MRSNQKQNSSIHASVNKVVDEIKEPNVIVKKEDIKSASSTQNELGWMGKLFGNGSNAKIYFVGLVSIFLTFTLCAYTLWNKFIPSEIFVTLLMTVLGYLFGKI